jgi:protein subunit release factor A
MQDEKSQLQNKTKAFVFFARVSSSSSASGRRKELSAPAARRSVAGTAPRRSGRTTIPTTASRTTG